MTADGDRSAKSKAETTPTPTEEGPETPDGVSRRRFLQACGIAAAGLAASAFVGHASLNAIGSLNVSGESDRDWVMVIDLNRCNGCGDCVRACQQRHNVPAGQEWITIYRMPAEDGSTYPFPRPCMQCDNPPCVFVCPVMGATFAREDGVVLIDQNRCIGCRYCMAACPYGARYFNWGGRPELTPDELRIYSPEHPVVHRRGTVEKCMFCIHQTPGGRLPQCVGSCVEGAMFFGDRREDAVTNSKGETLALSELLRNGAFRWKEELGTRPRVYYVPRRGGP